MPTLTRKIRFTDDDDNIIINYTPTPAALQAQVSPIFRNSNLTNMAQLIGTRTLPSDATIDSIRISGTITYKSDDYIYSNDYGLHLGGAYHFAHANGTYKEDSEPCIFTLTPDDNSVGLSLTEIQNKLFTCTLATAGTITIDINYADVVYTSESMGTLTLSHTGPGYTQLFYGDTCIYSFGKEKGEHVIELPYCGNAVAYNYWIKVTPKYNNVLSSIKVYRNANGTLTYMSAWSKEAYNLGYSNIANGKIEVVTENGSNLVTEHKVLTNKAFMKNRLVQEIKMGEMSIIGAHESNYYGGSESLVQYHNCHTAEKLFEYDYCINNELYDKNENIKGTPEATGGKIYEYGERQKNDKYVTRHVYNESYGRSFSNFFLSHQDIVAIRNIHGMDVDKGTIAYSFSDNDNLESIEFEYMGNPNESSSLNGLPGLVSNCPKLRYVNLGKVYQGNTKTMHGLTKNSYNIEEIWGLNLSGIAYHYSNPMGYLAKTEDYGIPKHNLRYLSIYCDSFDLLASFFHKIAAYSDYDPILETHNDAASGEYVIDISLCPRAVLDLVEDAFSTAIADHTKNYGWTIVTTPSSRYCTGLKFTNGANTTAITSLTHDTEGEEVLDMNDILFPYVTPKNTCKEPIRWSSSDRTIGYFENELSSIFIVKKSGTVTITAKCGTKTAQCTLTLNHYLTAPTIFITSDHLLNLMQGSYCQAFLPSYMENTYSPFIIDDFTPYVTLDEGIDHYINIYRFDMNEEPTLFRLDGLIPTEGGYWNDWKDDGSSYELIKYAYVPTSNNMNFTYGIQINPYSETGYDLLINKALKIFNEFLPALNVSMVEQSSNKLTFMEYEDTWLAVTTSSSKGYFLINMNTRTLRNDYGEYNTNTTSTEYRKWQGTLVHELGHTLGFDDEATHAPTIYDYSRDRAKCLWLQPNDKTALKEMIMNTYGIDITKSQEEITAQWISIGGNRFNSAATFARDGETEIQMFDYFDYGNELEEYADVIVNGTLKYVETKTLNISKNKNPGARFNVKYRIYSIEVESTEKGELKEALIKIPVNAMKDIEENVKYKLYLKQYENSPCSFVSNKGYIKL